MEEQKGFKRPSAVLQDKDSVTQDGISKRRRLETENGSEPHIPFDLPAINWGKFCARCAEIKTDKKRDSEFVASMLAVMDAYRLRESEECCITGFQRLIHAALVEVKLDEIFLLAWIFDNSLGVPYNVPVALTLYQQAAEMGHSTAQYNLACTYDRGEEVPRDVSKAIEWYEKAIAQGYKEAQFNLGFIYAHDDHVERDYSRAAKLYTLAASQGDSDAEAFLGECYISGQGVEKDLEKGVALYRKAAEKGQPMALCALGQCYMEGLGVEKDLEKGTQLLQSACDLEDAEACYTLGICYLEGNGVGKDPAKGIALLQAAAKQENPNAQYYLGALYHIGGGADVPRDARKALPYLQAASSQGHAHAQSLLGDLYFAKKKEKEALECFYSAAKLGSADAYVSLGTVYAGVTPMESVPIDNKKAANFYFLAGTPQKDREEVEVDALFNLGLLYETGTGVPLDAAKAYGLFSAGARGGSAESRDAISDLLAEFEGSFTNLQA